MGQPALNISKLQKNKYRHKIAPRLFEMHMFMCKYATQMKSALCSVE